MPFSDQNTPTAQMLLHEIAALEKLTVARLNAIEKAVEMVHEEQIRVPSETQKAINNLRELMESKQSTLLMALQASKESVAEQNRASATAINKSEASTNKQLDQLQVLISAVRDGINSSIVEVNERIARVESLAQGAQAAKSEMRDDSKIWISIAGVVAAFVGIVIGLLVKT